MTQEPPAKPKPPVTPAATNNDAEEATNANGRDDAGRDLGPLPMALPSAGPPDPPKVPGKHERCVHCGAVTFLERSASLRYKCGICGKARVPVDDPKLRRSNDEKDALLRASLARNAASAWSVAAGVSGAVGAVSLAVVLLFFLALSPGFFVTAFAFLAALLPLALAAFGVVQSRRKRAGVEPALLEGWQSVAQEIIDARKEVTSGELAKALRTTPEHAETLLAHLLANGDVTSPIPDDGEVRYRSSKAPLRVAVEDPVAVIPAKHSADAVPEVKAAVDERERDLRAEEELAEEEIAEATRPAREGSRS